MTRNTDCIDTVTFRPHGRVEWAPAEDGIIVYKAYGPFNAELFDAVISLESEDFENLQKEWGHWVEIILFVDSCFVMKDAIENYQHFLKQCVDEGAAPIASAFVYTPGIEGANLSNASYRKAYEYAGVEYQEFEGYEQALVWAREKLKEITTS